MSFWAKQLQDMWDNVQGEQSDRGTISSCMTRGDRGNRGKHGYVPLHFTAHIDFTQKHVVCRRPHLGRAPIAQGWSENVIMVLGRGWEMGKGRLLMHEALSNQIASLAEIQSKPSH